MTKNLLIVESPAKAKTIEKFLGKDFKVTSCYGHIRDLQKGNDAIDISKNFSPKYVIPKDKEKIVKELKRLAKDAEVWLATDEDREGEAISWHLCDVLGLDPNDTKRIVFHEITKPAIQSAVSSPRKVNLDLVNAQQARRILDRIVGFEISPILWRKISMSGALSAGRVQSVAVRLVVEREEEISSFNSHASFKVVGNFELHSSDGKKGLLKATLAKNLSTREEAEAFLEKCKKARFTIGDIQVKPAKKSPAAPFTTSTLQQEAGRKLGFSVSKTMMIAQRLYEAGKITYMRTDSVNLSDTALSAVAGEIKQRYGDEFSQRRNYKTKSASAQEAHEAIRPSYIDQDEAGSNYDEQRLYELIWKRTIASQMADAKLERTIVKIDISTSEEKFTAKGEVILFEGFLKVYFESSDDENEDDESGILPPMTQGQELNMEKIAATERYTRPPARYSEASLVRKLEELGIGRPSTYAPTISTIQKRGYVSKDPIEGKTREYHVLTLQKDQIDKKVLTEISGAEKNKLHPTDAGILVNGFLIKHFPKIMDYQFTATIEKEFDLVAEGKVIWNNMLSDFYTPFHKNVEETIENADRVTGERKLGTDPKSGRPVIARMGKYGPMVQIGTPDDEEKPKFAKLGPKQNIRTISLDEAIELFKLPRQLGEYEEKVVVASTGRFGPYIRHDNKFVSIKEGDPLSISLEEAIELIKTKREADAKKLILDFPDEDIQVLNGRWGAYVKKGKTNVRVPKEKDPEKLSLEECITLIEKGPPKKKTLTTRKKKSK